MSRGVVWVSTSTSTRGGVASYVRTMQQTPLWEAWQIRHVATHRDGSVATRLLVFVAGTGSVVRELVLRRPLVVHLHAASYGSFARKSILAWACRLVGTPVVIHVHGAEFNEFFQRRSRLLKRYIRVTLETSRVVIALGDTWARRLEQIAPGVRILVVPNAVRPRTEVAQPSGGEPVRALFLGEIGDRKGAFTLIESWRRCIDVLDQRIPAELVMAGDGEVDRARRRVTELGLDDQVRVCSWLPSTEVEDLLRSSQILVLPSRNEGQPMAVLEAMANGLCVITTPVGGLPDLVDDSCGVVVPVDDVPALAQALARVVADEPFRRGLGARALERVKERFDVDATWTVLDSLYQEMRR